MRATGTRKGRDLLGIEKGYKWKQQKRKSKGHILSALRVAVTGAGIIQQDRPRFGTSRKSLKRKRAHITLLGALCVFLALV
jgi:hypothetical protein